MAMKISDAALNKLIAERSRRQQDQRRNDTISTVTAMNRELTELNNKIQGLIKKRQELNIARKRFIRSMGAGSSYVSEGIPDDLFRKLWLANYADYLKSDGYTVNITDMAGRLGLNYHALIEWVRENYPKRLSSSSLGASGKRVAV